jgi:hypothetical protein
MKVQNPLIGRSSGKFANSIFQTWNGLNTVRAKPLTVANPRTPAQVAQRAIIAFLAVLGQALAPLTFIGYRIPVVGQSRRSRFAKANYPALSYDSNTQEVNLSYLDLKLSDGSMTSQAGLGVSIAGNNKDLTVSFATAPADSTQAGTDKVYIFAINEDDPANSAQLLGTRTRSQGTAPISLASTATSGDTISVYVFFASVTSNNVSDSERLTLTV